MMHLLLCPKPWLSSNNTISRHLLFLLYHSIFSTTTKKMNVILFYPLTLIFNIAERKQLVSVITNVIVATNYGGKKKINNNNNCSLFCYLETWKKTFPHSGELSDCYKALRMTCAPFKWLWMTRYYRNDKCFNMNLIVIWITIRSIARAAVIENGQLFLIINSV